MFIAFSATNFLFTNFLILFFSVLIYVSPISLICSLAIFNEKLNSGSPHLQTIKALQISVLLDNI